MKSIRLCAVASFAAACVTTMLAQPAQAQTYALSTGPQQTLTHWWKANGNTVDSITGKSGALVGGTTYASGNWGGKAFDFNGTNSAVELESKNGAGNLIGGEKSRFTIAMWVNLASVPNIQMLAEFHYLQANQAIFFIQNNYCASGENIAMAFRGYDQWLVPIDLDSMVGKWSLLTVEYNGGDPNVAASFSYYLNGVQLTGSSQSCGAVGGSQYNDNSLGWDQQGQFWYDGLMDDVQIYNFDLSSKQVNYLVTHETLAK